MYCIYLCLTPKNAQKTCVETDDRRTDLKPIVLAPTLGLVAGPAHQNIPVDSMPKSQSQGSKFHRNFIERTKENFEISYYIRLIHEYSLLFMFYIVLFLCKMLYIVLVNGSVVINYANIWLRSNNLENPTFVEV